MLLLLWVLFGLSMAVGRVIARVAAGRLFSARTLLVIGDTTMSDAYEASSATAPTWIWLAGLIPRRSRWQDYAARADGARARARLVIAVGHPMDEHTLHLVRMAGVTGPAGHAGAEHPRRGGQLGGVRRSIGECRSSAFSASG